MSSFCKWYHYRCSIKQVVMDIYKPQSGSRSPSSSRTPLSVASDSCNLDHAVINLDSSGNQSNLIETSNTLKRKRHYSQVLSDQSNVSPSSPCERKSLHPVTTDQLLRASNLGSLRAVPPLRMPLEERVVEGGNSPECSTANTAQTNVQKPVLESQKTRHKKRSSPLPWIPDISIVEKVNSFSGHFLDVSYSEDTGLCPPDMAVCGELLLPSREWTAGTDSSSPHASDGDDMSSYGEQASKVAQGTSTSAAYGTTMMQVWALYFPHNSAAWIHQKPINHGLWVSGYTH